MEGSEGISQDVVLELEALDALGVTYSFPSPETLHVDIIPYTGEEELEFVRCVLSLQLHHYPCVPPSVSIVAERGLKDGCSAQLESSLHDLLEEMPPPEPILVPLVQHATEFLSEINRPQRECCVCLSDDWQSKIPPPRPWHGTIRLSACFHCLHASCFVSYMEHSAEVQITDVTRADGAQILKIARARRQAEILPPSEPPPVRGAFDPVTFDYSQSGVEAEARAARATASAAALAAVLAQDVSGLAFRCPVCRQEYHSEEAVQLALVAVRDHEELEQLQDKEEEGLPPPSDHGTLDPSNLDLIALDQARAYWSRTLTKQRSLGGTFERGEFGGRSREAGGGSCGLLYRAGWTKELPTETSSSVPPPPPPPSSSSPTAGAGAVVVVTEGLGQATSVNKKEKRGGGNRHHRAPPQMTTGTVNSRREEHNHDTADQNDGCATNTKKNQGRPRRRRTPNPDRVGGDVNTT